VSRREGSEGEGEVVGFQELLTGETKRDEQIEIFGFEFLR
jgi:hypothetical protein